jgi:hypothetical protein
VARQVRCVTRPLSPARCSTRPNAIPATSWTRAPDHLVGEDRAGALLLFPAVPRGWAKRTVWTGMRRQSRRSRRPKEGAPDGRARSAGSLVGNTAEMAPGSHRMAQAIARSLISNPSILVLEVRGHSDSLLHPADRADLARQRAEVVAAHIIAQGVDPARLTTYGASDSELRYPADDPRNRRVEFIILARDE